MRVTFFFLTVGVAVCSIACSEDADQRVDDMQTTTGTTVGGGMMGGGASVGGAGGMGSGGADLGEPVDGEVTTEGCWTVTELDLDFGRVATVALMPDGSVALGVAAEGAIFVVRERDGVFYRDVDFAEDAGSNAEFVRVVADGARTHVVYDDVDNAGGASNGLRHALQVDGAWQLSTYAGPAPNPNQPPLSPSGADIVVAPDGVAYALLGPALDLVTIEAGVGTYRRLVEGGGFGTPGLALDTARAIHGVTAREGRILYSPDVLVSPFTDALIGGKFSPSLAVSSDGTVAIAYDDNEGSLGDNLWVATNQGGGWQTSRIGEYTVRDTDVGFMPDGSLRVLAANALLATPDGDSWTVERTPEVSGPFGANMVIDNTGAIHVGLVQQDSRSIVYAVCAPN